MENRPETKFRAGGVTATVWRNNSEAGSYGTVKLERTYMDKEKNWKSTNSFRVNDLPKASLVLQKAFEYLAVRKEAEV